MTIRDEKERVMTAAEIKNFQKILAEVGSRKRRGVIQIFTLEDKGGGHFRTDGIMFGNDVPKVHILKTFLKALEINPLEVLLALNQLQEK